MGLNKTLLSGIIANSGSTAARALATINSMFGGGDDGCYYDLSDPTNIFKDVARTLPVSANNDPIASVFDKSGHGKHWQRLSADSQRPVWDSTAGALVTDGVNNWLFSQMVWTSAWTVIAVIKSNGTPGGQLFGRDGYNCLKDGATMVYWGGDSANQAHLLYDTETLRTQPFTFSTVRASDSVQTFRFNGQPLGAPIAPSTAHQPWLTIGAESGFGYSKGATTCWQFFAINRALSDTEVFKVECALRAMATAPAFIPEYGYDVFVVAGQSNTFYGASFDAGIDTPDPNIFEYTQFGTVRQALDPLDNLGGRAGSAGHIGFAMTFAKAYVAATGRRVLLVHCGRGGAGFSTAYPTTWAAGSGSLRDQTIVKTNAALAFGNTIKGILWHQGESDELDSANYQANLDGLIAEFRSSITGAANVPFVTGGLGPVWVGGNANRLTVQSALSTVAARNSKAGYADSYFPTQLDLSDGQHFTAAAQRIFGGRYYDAYLSALSDA